MGHFFRDRRYGALFILLLCIAPLVNCAGEQEDNAAVMAGAGLLYSLNYPFMPGPLVDYSYRESPGQGRLLTAQRLYDLPQNYAELFVNLFLKQYSGKSLADYPALRPETGVAYYYITYQTLDVQGNLVTASAAIWVPRRDGALPLLAYCHGTNADTAMDTTRVQAGLFAARGFLSVGADYLGYGASEGMDHPYCHAATLASSTIDSILAARHFADYNGIPLNGKLFITGVSEGGMTAMATVRELEAHYTAELPLTASAPLSGPYDLTGTSSAYIIPNKVVSGNQLNYLVFIIPVYNSIFNVNRPLSYYLKEPYATWFTEHRYPRADAATIGPQIPKNTSSLLTASFISSFGSGGEPDIAAALAQNNTYGFVPQAPLRMYGALSDTHVPVANANTALAYFLAHGADPARVTLETLPGDHGTVLPFFVRMIEWFLTF